MIAIATALITAGTTISVAYISKSSSAPSPSPNSGPSPAVNPAPVATPNVAPQPAYQTVQQAANIAGNWRSPDNSEQLFIQQNGGQISLSLQGSNTQLGYYTATGQGTVNGRDATYAIKMVLANGQSVEVECALRLISDSSSLQGTCGSFGKNAPGIYVR
jgi:hypothetical protein